MRTLTKEGCEFISYFEGKVNHIYDDGVGYLTIGIGHLCVNGDYYLKNNTIESLKEIYKKSSTTKKVSYSVNGKPKSFYVKTCDYFVTNFSITDDEVNKLLQKDLAKFCQAVETNVKTTLTDNQFTACVSLAFNIGIGTLNGSKGFLASSLFKAINNQDYTNIKNLFNLFNKAGGKESPGLVARRKAEGDLFFT